ncbi:SDR family NAD(P)-dependent oxidoreductase [Kordiimonas lacus]|uniref:NAD(P)-dependent dehydrogenase, short-chain alcohol dehydrogenase family n=1 Tax=Kordiimonas lacus TaxID=637679 RepID=A0A1G7EEQ1_9PROT|nr:SDR family oxidoreductase [Kordiimonas lacus]SDE61966.1 NAD(P)-dependent dehydrogenase, short-chain alcohol dehydrogenase family [Kordiimonas lacus]
MRFEAKRVIVTGGTSGFGEAIVKAFAAEGADVHFCGLIDTEGKRVMADAEGLSGTVQYHHADVREESSVAAFIHKATDDGTRLDIAVNNAGISHTAARFADQDMAMVEDVFRTNVMGIWFAMRHEIPVMLKSGTGAIVNTASILSRSGAEWMAAYGTSKHAVVGLTKSAALDYADHGIRINAVSPGPMLTPMFERALADIGGDMSKFAGGLPKGGPANPNDVAKTVLYLASEEAGYMNGANVIVDGGTSSGQHA